MRRLLTHINTLFTLIFLICTGSAYGQNSNFISTEAIISVTDGLVVSKNVDTRAIDLGLNDVYWADRNVDANSSTDYGSYYTWSEASTWNTSTSSVTPQWGGFWRTPTEGELKDLKKRSEDYTTNTPGIRITHNNNYIVIPASGYWQKDLITNKYSLGGDGERGYLWSSDYISGSRAYYYMFVNTKLVIYYRSESVLDGDKDSKLPIRPVIDKCTSITVQARYDGATQPFATYINITCPKGTSLSSSNDECYTHKWYGYKNGNSFTPDYDAAGNCLVTESGAVYEIVYTKKETTITAGPAQSDNEGGKATIQTTANGTNGGYNCGTPVELTANPEGCYTFKYWIQTIGNDTVHIPGDNAPDYITSCTTDNTTGINILKVTVPSDVAAIDYHAVFAKRPLTITAAPNDGSLGSITDSTGNHNYATTQTFGVDCGNRFIVKATPSGGCIVVEKWVDDLECPTVVYTPGNSNDDYTCTTDEDGVNTLTINSVNKQLNLKAVFVKQDYYIDSDVQPENSGQVEITYSEVSDICDRTISLEATPNECYAFNEWKMKVIRNGQEELIDLQGESTIEDLQVTESTTFVAYFEIKDVTVTIKSDTDQGTVEFVDEENDQ